MKVIITKRALTKGPEIMEVEITSIPGMVKSKVNFFSNFHGEGREWHRTKESASKKMLHMFNSKRISLEKQLRDLDSKETKALEQLAQLNLE